MSGKKLITRISILSICIYLILPCFPVFGDNDAVEIKTIATGMVLPQFTLNAPGSESMQKYLGLAELKPFSFSQVSAKIILLEIFSFYCPHCRKQAAVLNKIYHFIKQDPKLSNDIKMVGIGAGSTENQLDGWKTTLHVPFPIFSDPETTIWQKFGKPAVPCTLIVSNTGKVLATHYGPSEDTEELFRQIKKFYNEQK